MFRCWLWIHKSYRIKWMCASALGITTPVFIAIPNFNAKLFGHIFRTHTHTVDQSPMSRCFGHRQIVINTYCSRIKLTCRSGNDLGQPHVCICDDKCKQKHIVRCKFSWIDRTSVFLSVLSNANSQMSVRRDAVLNKIVKMYGKKMLSCVFRII